MSSEVTMESDGLYGNGLFLGAEERDGALEVYATPQAKEAPESLWFCFRLKFKSKRSRKIRLVLKHFQNSLGGFPVEAVNPVARVAGGRWERLQNGRSLPLGDGRCDAVWETMASSSIEFAFCFPYGFPELKSLLEGAGGYLKKDVVGVSPEGRELVRISNNYGSTDSKMPGLYLMARQHAGETTGSWAMHGFLKRLAELKAEGLSVWAIPLSNIDGIEKGFYGKDNFPMDLNRAWGPCPMRYETNVFQRDVARWAERVEPSLAIDFHSPGGSESDGVYCFLPVDECGSADPESSEWSRSFEEALKPDFAAASFGRVANYPSRWDHPYAHFEKYMNKVYKIPTLSFEFPYSQIRGRVLNAEDYVAIGSRMAEAVLKRLKA